MRACVLTATGGLDQLQITDVFYLPNLDFGL